MNKLKMLAVLLLVLLPTGMMAQTKVTDPESGLVYLQKDDGKGLYITVSGSDSDKDFIPDYTFRIQMKNNYNSRQESFYKIDLDAINTLNCTWNVIADYTGIEYFRNLDTLAIASNNPQIGGKGSAGNDYVSLDLSKNPKLKSLTFNNTNRMKYLNISNTQLTSVTVPTSIQILVCTNTPKLTSLDLSSCTGLSSITYDKTQFTPGDNLQLSGDSWQVAEEEGDIVTIIPTSALSLTLDVTNKEDKEVDLSAFAKLENLTLKGGATTLTLYDNLPSTTFTLDATGCPDLVVQDFNHPNVQTLTLKNVNQIDISKCAKLKTLTCQGNEWGDLSDGHLGLICNTGATEDSWTLPALTRINAENSGVRKLDLTNAGKNVDMLFIANSQMTELYIPNHTKFTLYKEDWGNNPSTAGVVYGGYNSAYPYYYRNSETNPLRINKLEILDISGTKITNLKLSDESKNNYNKAPLKKLYARNCDKLEQITCLNSELDEMDLSGCTNLKTYVVEQNYLKTVNLSGCQNLDAFRGKRCQFEDLDFLTLPCEGRTAEHIAKLRNIQVNGGAYATTIKEEKDEEKTIVPAVTTNKIRRLDTQYLSSTLRTLLVGDNMLEELDIHEGLNNLDYLQCENNMLLSLDLTHLKTTGLNMTTKWGWKKSSNEVQAGFVNVEVVKGDAEDGSKDRVAIHLPVGSKVEWLDEETIHLYPSRQDADAGTNEMVKGAKPDIVNLTAEQCPTGQAGAHLILHGMADVLNNNGGKVLDHNLYDKWLTYQYNTNFNNGKKTGSYEPFIEVRVQIWPYLLNINPATKESEGNTTGTSFYSSTIYLDYDAIIPAGVKVFAVTGLREGYKETGQPNNAYNAQLVLKEIGGPGEVLPAETPVIVQSATSAGLYSFQTAWDFDIQGWEDYRTNAIKKAYSKETGIPEDELIPVLHGADEDHIKYRAEYDPITHPEKWVNLKNSGENADALESNLLSGTLEDMTVASKSILVLGRQKAPNLNGYVSMRLGFWRYKGTSLGAHRCYITNASLKKALDDANITDAKEGGAFFFEGETTGIRTVSDEPQQSVQAVYDLQGRRIIGKPAPGVYIVNGKKVVVKQ